MRPTKTQYFMGIAKVVAQRSTCVRRSVGCVIVDHHDRIMSTGHNGVPPGVTHCTDVPCPGSQCPSGTGLELCEATHAEINALLFCSDVRKIKSVYVTTFPCMQCIKALMATSAEAIYFAEPYAATHDRARQMWEQSKRLLIQVTDATV